MNAKTKKHACGVKELPEEKRAELACKGVQFIEKAEPSPERRKAAIERWRASYNMPTPAE